MSKGDIVRRFTKLVLLAILACGGGLMQLGCRDDAPSPPRVPVPAANNRDQLHEREYVKPLPGDVSRARD